MTRLYFIPLSLALAFERLAALRRVSAVARGEVSSTQTQGGFFQAARRARGDVRKLQVWPVKPGSTQTWWERRNNFCERHTAQQASQNTPLVETSGPYRGTPSRRQLGLIMWLGSNLTPARLQSMLPRVREILQSQRS